MLRTHCGETINEESLLYQPPQSIGTTYSVFPAAGIDGKADSFFSKLAISEPYISYIGEYGIAVIRYRKDGAQEEVILYDDEDFLVKIAKFKDIPCFIEEAKRYFERCKKKRLQKSLINGEQVEIVIDELRIILSKESIAVLLHGRQLVDDKNFLFIRQTNREIEIFYTEKRDIEAVRIPASKFAPYQVAVLRLFMRYYQRSEENAGNFQKYLAHRAKRVQEIEHYNEEQERLREKRKYLIVIFLLLLYALSYLILRYLVYPDMVWREFWQEFFGINIVVGLVLDGLFGIYVRFFYFDKDIFVDIPYALEHFATASLIFWLLNVASYLFYTNLIKPHI